MESWTPTTEELHASSWSPAKCLPASSDMHAPVIVPWHIEPDELQLDVEPTLSLPATKAPMALIPPSQQLHAVSNSVCSATGLADALTIEMTPHSCVIGSDAERIFNVSKESSPGGDCKASTSQILSLSGDERICSEPFPVPQSNGSAATMYSKRAVTIGQTSPHGSKIPWLPSNSVHCDGSATVLETLHLAALNQPCDHMTEPPFIISEEHCGGVEASRQSRKSPASLVLAAQPDIMQRKPQSRPVRVAHKSELDPNAHCTQDPVLQSDPCVFGESSSTDEYAAGVRTPDPNICPSVYKCVGKPLAEQQGACKCSQDANTTTMSSPLPSDISSVIFRKTELRDKPPEPTQSHHSNNRRVFLGTMPIAAFENAALSANTVQGLGPAPAGGMVASGDSSSTFACTGSVGHVVSKGQDGHTTAHAPIPHSVSTPRRTPSISSKSKFLDLARTSKPVTKRKTRDCLQTHDSTTEAGNRSSSKAQQVSDCDADGVLGVSQLVAHGQLQSLLEGSVSKANKSASIIATHENAVVSPTSKSQYSLQNNLAGLCTGVACEHHVPAYLQKNPLEHHSRYTEEPGKKASKQQQALQFVESPFKAELPGSDLFQLRNNAACAAPLCNFSPHSAMYKAPSSKAVPLNQLLAGLAQKNSQCDSTARVCTSSASPTIHTLLQLARCMWTMCTWCLYLYTPLFKALKPLRSLLLQPC
jgi:hypothetical protein